MKHLIAASRRLGFAVFACVALGAVSTQALAQCNPNVRIFPENQTVPETTGGAPTVVTLDGANSTPRNGTLSFFWTQTAGPSVVLNGPTNAKPTFAAPAVGPAGVTLTFRLTIRCPGAGGATDTLTTNVNITDVVTNSPPTAIAVASPESATEGTLVTLDGSASTDPDPGTTLTYNWEQVSGSPLVTLANSNHAGSIVTFVAPNVAATASLGFRLTVSDGSLAATTTKLVNIVWTNDPPVARLACPANGLFEVDEGQSVTYNGTTSSDADGTIVSYTWDQASGLPNLDIGSLATASITFNAPQLGYMQLGGTLIRLTVTDNDGASSSAECGLFIRDITKPVISVPADIVAEADSADGKVVDYTVLAQDAVDDEIAYTLPCSPLSGSTFGLAAAPTQQKTTAVACSATDSAGNNATAGFNVTVRDTTPPEITVPGSHGIEATSADGAIASFLATTADAVDGAGLATCVPATGSQFPLGTTSVSCSATDARGNTATPAGFNLTVHDTTAPAVTPPPNVEAEATGPLTNVDFEMATATDAVGVTAIDHDAPASFPVGITTITWTARDAAGNSGKATSTVTVNDTTPPTVTVPADILGVEATSAVGAAVSFDASASDLVDGDLVATCFPPSGSTFDLGTTMVNCTATDLANNEGHAGFSVEVVDTTPPTIASHGDVGPVEATSAAGAVASYTSPATFDIVDGAGTATCAPLSGSTFALGESTVTCNATDAAGNDAVSTSFKVTVVDTTGPRFAPYPATIFATASANSQAAVSFDLPTATDLVDGPVTVTCDRASGSSFNAGSTTVNCSARDGRNPANVSTMSFVVKVDFSWTGFFRPVDNLPTVNVVQAGSAIPVKFNLGGNQGLAIFAAGFPNSAPIGCGTGPTDVIPATETVTAGGSSLQFDATTGQYNYVWKTEKSWAGSCRVLQLTLKDGSVHKATFQFKK